MYPSGTGLAPESPPGVPSGNPDVSSVYMFGNGFLCKWVSSYQASRGRLPFADCSFFRSVCDSESDWWRLGSEDIWLVKIHRSESGSFFSASQSMCVGSWFVASVLRFSVPAGDCAVASLLYGPRCVDRLSRPAFVHSTTDPREAGPV